MIGKLHFISAGAGSGKTHKLTEILHEKLSNGSVRPSGVIATTFTRKAATELRERVRSHLLEQGAYTIANAMGQARITTVNGVCGELLARFAFEAGLSTEQQVLEEAQEAALLMQAIDNVVGGEEMAKLLAMVRRLGIEDWKKNLSEIIKQTRSNCIARESIAGFAEKNADEMLAYFGKAAKDDLTTLLVKTIDQWLPELEQVALEGKKKNTNAYLVLVRDMRRKLLEDDYEWSEWAKLANSAPEKPLAHISESISAVANRYEEHPALHKDVRDYLKMVFDFSSRSMRAYEGIKLEKGVLDFTDQESLLLKALDNKVVAQTLREELDLIMVDEFQDTSPIQLALFLKLAQFAKEIYWVGDIKQAIYGFRGSDTTLMKAILAKLPELGGDKQYLSESWRSREPLVKLVNEVFVPAFANGLKPNEITLSAEPKSRKVKLSGAALGNWQLKGRKVEERIAAMAVGVSKLIASGYQVYDKPTGTVRAIRYGDFAILARSNPRVKDIAAELRKQGLPAAIAQPGLLKTPEAVLAMACLRRLNDPSDTIASAEIISLAGCEEPESWVADRLRLMAEAPEKLPSGYGDDWREAGENAHPLLSELALLRADMPIFSPLEAMQAVIARGRLSAIVLRWSCSEAEARTRLANLEALISMAREYEDSSRNTSQTASVSGLILWLQDQAAAELDLLANPAIDAVQVMTHHGAKGLEWPVVILMDLEKAIRTRLWSITAISLSTVDAQQPLKDRFIRFWPWPFGKMEKVTIAEKIAASPIAQSFYADAVDEEKRLLYVSMTRARDLLILTRDGEESEESWIGAVHAGWLNGGEDATELKLPSGEKIPYQHWLLEPPEEQSESAARLTETIFWLNEESSFSDLGGHKRLPLKYTPNTAIQLDCKVVEKVLFGERMQLKPGVDMAQIGTAIHGCIGAHFTDPNAPISENEITALLKRMDLVDTMRPDEVLGKISQFSSWINARWPGCIPFAEMPTQMLMDNGQLLNGRIDLLLKVNGGWILIDHKSSTEGSDKWERLAQEYAGQLAAYKSAIERASGEKVLENWLFLPVAGAAIRVE